MPQISDGKIHSKHQRETAKERTCCKCDEWHTQIPPGASVQLTLKIARFKMIYHIFSEHPALDDKID